MPSDLPAKHGYPAMFNCRHHPKDRKRQEGRQRNTDCYSNGPVFLAQNVGIAPNLAEHVRAIVRLANRFELVFQFGFRAVLNCGKIDQAALAARKIRKVAPVEKAVGPD